MQRGLLPSPALILKSCGQSRTQGTQGVGVCANHNILIASSSTSFYLFSPLLQSRMLALSLWPHRGESLTLAVFVTAVDLPRQPGR